MDDEKAQPAGELRRVITLWPLALYGLGVIVGAGIYVAIGAVIARASAGAPLSFLIAGVAALLTGLCYAELGARYPEAAGAAVYVRQAFGSDRLAQLIGLLTTIAVAISTASIAGGTVRYLQELLALSAALMLTVVIVGFSLIAAIGVRSSVWLAALIGSIEIGGLLVAIGVGLPSADLANLPRLIPGTEAWAGIMGGAFIAFFAYIGFETMANMAEEVREPARNLPRSIIIAVAASLALYVAVAAVTVLNQHGGEVPLLGLFEGRSAAVFALLGAVAISNGVLVQIVMLARLFYGMAKRGQLPSALGRVNQRTRTPILATAVAGTIVLATALALPFEQLIAIANAITLVIFVAVDLALWRIQRRGEPGRRIAPSWLPPLAALFALVLLASELIS